MPSCYANRLTVAGFTDWSGDYPISSVAGDLDGHRPAGDPEPWELDEDRAPAYPDGQRFGNGGTLLVAARADGSEGQ